MILTSTLDRAERTTFREAVVRGIPPDGGLYMPMEIPRMSTGFFEEIRERDFQGVAGAVAQRLLADEIPPHDIERIVRDACSFPVPLVHLEDDLSILELFHGPTFAFKDFGARFLAQVLAYVQQNDDRMRTILVATSGDTGSAVAQAFLGMQGFRVVLLYPGGKVSPTQEQQLTTVGGNVTALEVDGTFDDCQRLVKNAFANSEIASRCGLTSANSINIARLIPQSFYYFEAYARAPRRADGIVFAVPSGNLGNLTGGLIAWKMGLPVRGFVAALNRNDVFGEYLETGTFSPRASVPTISNAMDVGNPSNIVRIMALRNSEARAFQQLLTTVTISEDETRQAIRRVCERYQYLLDPHGAVAFAALQRIGGAPETMRIALATAHPAKFPEIVEPLVGYPIKKPLALEEALNRLKHSVPLLADDEQLRTYLLDTQN